MNFLRSFLGFLLWLYYFLFMLPVTAFCALGVIVCAPFTPKSGAYFLRGFARLWGWTAVRIIFNKVIVLGKENLPGKGCVIVSNHQSLFDIYAALGFYPIDFLFLAKQEMRKAPLVGYAMAKSGYLFIDRKSPIRASRSLAEAAEKIKAGDSVLIYPEGTRSPDPADFLPFKPGTVKIAKKGGLPILPIVLYGTQQVKPNNPSRFMRRHPIVIRVMPAIEAAHELHPANSDQDDKTQLNAIRKQMMLVYGEMAKAYGK